MNDLKEARPGSWAVFLSYSLPAVAGTMLSSGAVVVDGLFVGRFVGPVALAAVNLTMPLLYLYLAVSVMISVGGANLAAQLSGAGRVEEASRVFSGALTLLCAASLAISALALAFLDPLLALLGARGEALAPAKEYLSIMLWFYFISMLNIGIGNSLRSGGKPVYPLILGLAGSAVDIFLDWYFIVALGMSMRGAALSSAAGAAVEAGLGLALVAAGKCEYRFAPPRLALSEIKTIFAIGSAEFIGQASVTIVAYIYNAVLMARMGLAGVAANAVSGYLSFVEYMFILGFMQGLCPLSARCGGSGDRAGARAWLGTALKASLAVAAGLAALGIAFPEALTRIFLAADGRGASLPEVIPLAKTAIVFVALSFLPGTYSAMATAFFSSVGEARSAALIASLRGLVLVSAFAIILPLALGDIGIWLALPAAEILTFALAALKMREWRAAAAMGASPTLG